MNVPSFEDLADRWTISHTIAVAAWVLVLVLALTLLLRGARNPYSTTDMLKTYAAENATFTYPANWTINNCVPGHAFIELPGTIKANYKGQKDYGLKIEGTGDYSCTRGRPERLDIYPETIVASDTPCAPASSTKGEKLDNGLYLQLAEEDGDVYGLSIHQNACFAPSGAAVLSFSFVDPDLNAGQAEGNGTPHMKTEAFVKSRQYQDIRALAQSIRY